MSKSLNNYSNEYLMEMKDKILLLNKNEYLEIYKIIKKHNINYTKNNNGIFINMNILTKESIEEINILLKYYTELNNKLNKIDLK